VELRFSYNTQARWRKEEQNHSCNQDCRLPASSCWGSDTTFLPGVTSCRGCDVAFLHGDIIIIVLRPRPRPRSSRSRSRARSSRSRSRSRPWGQWGRGRCLGHWDRGHHLVAEVGEVEAVRSARSRSRSRSPRSRSSPWGRGRQDRGHDVGEVEGEVFALRLKLVRSRPRGQGWGRGLGQWGRGHCLEAEATEVSEVGEGQVGEVEDGLGIGVGD
jgi:hypothetical protein